MKNVTTCNFRGAFREYTRSHLARLNLNSYSIIMYVLTPSIFLPKFYLKVNRLLAY